MSGTLERNEAEIVAAMARGETRAVEWLYDLHAPLMLGVATKMLKDRNAAEDLVHDVFLEAWRSAAGYREDRGSVKTWLMVRLRSRALDRLRSHQVSKRSDSPVEALSDRAANPNEDPEFTSDRNQVRAVLSRLPELQRKVLHLAYFEGLSSSEIAERLEIPVGTVKSRAATALRKLREELDVGLVA